MKSKTLFIGMVVIAISVLIVGMAVSTNSDDLLGNKGVSDAQSETGRHEVTVTTVTPSSDELLGKYERSDRLFKRTEWGDWIFYRHRRMIDGIKVEGNEIAYIFNRNTKELIEKDIHWRDDLPKHLPPVISKEQAESIAGGGSATLYFLSTGGIFPTQQAPRNPCWVVWKTIKTDEYGIYFNITIVDAVEGRILGYGIPPEYTGFSFSGPSDPTNCTGNWSELCENAKNWFETMGYPTEGVVMYPDKAKIKSHIQNYETAMFYWRAHGGSGSFTNDCSGSTTADEIHDWIFEDYDYTLMPFTFVGGCGGMCEVGPGTLSYEFRKGSPESTVTVGQCGMHEPPCNQTCWYNEAKNWQNEMFSKMSQGWTVNASFDWACKRYDGCYNESAGIRCVRFAGDPNLKVVPVVERGKLGDVNRNHRIDTGDATLVLRYIVGLPIPPKYQPVYPIGDMNNNHRIDTGDATLILRKVVGLLSGGTSAPAPVAESVALDIGSYTTYVKSDIAVPVEISNASAVAGGSLKILFDSSIVKVKAVTSGDFNEPVANIDNENGFVHIAASRATAVGIENAVLANITFTGISEDSTALKIQQPVINYEDGNTREPKMSDGEIRTMNYDDKEALKETLEKNAEVFGKVYEEYPERG